MSDLIDRQAAIEALYDWEMTYDWDDHCRKEDPKPAYIVSPSDVIEELSSARQWIPCSERPPETNGRYFVTRGLKACNAIWNRVYIINYSDLMGLKAEKIWWDGNVGKSDFQIIDDVIAWMPLIEPYKGEQE